jgi:uncharacterized membrane protein
MLTVKMAIQLGVLLVIMIVLDIVWLTATATTSRTMIAAIQGSPLQIRWLPAALVYILMVIATWYFAVQPAKTIGEAATNGALLGFCMYGLYDLTNYATLSRYTLSFALTDMSWGTLLLATAAAAATASAAATLV